MQQEYIDQLFPIVLALVTAVSGLLLKTLNQYVATKVNDTRFTAATTRLNEVVNTVVLHIQQTQVDQIKAARADSSPGGSKITREEAEQIARIALHDALAYFGEAGAKEISRAFNFDNRVTFEAFVKSKIEAAVQTIRQNTFLPGTTLITPDNDGDNVRLDN